MSVMPFSDFRHQTGRLIGTSPVFLDALALAERWAMTDAPIMLIGATGTGKELFARRIHAASNRTGPLVPVNCFSLRPELAYGLLFGHRRGAFTGAVDNSRGYCRQADRGTLFLDELASLPQDSQAALLRFIETGEIQPVGRFDILHADVRVVTAVHDDIENLVSEGRLRDDLYQRLAIGIVRLPPLEERPGDIPLLASWFASQWGRTLTSAAQEVMADYGWPGNVRELRGTIERACVLADDPVLDAHHIRAALLARGTISGAEPLSPRPSGDHDLRSRLLQACAAARGDIGQVADRLGTTKSTIYRWLQKWGLSAAEIRRSVRSHNWAAED